MPVSVRMLGSLSERSALETDAKENELSRCTSALRVTYLLCAQEVLATTRALRWIVGHDVVWIVSHREVLARCSGLLAPLAQLCFELRPLLPAALRARLTRLCLLVR